MALLLSLLPAAVSHQLDCTFLQVPERSATSTATHPAALFAFMAAKSLSRAVLSSRAPGRLPH